jgi:hypothetical protein
MFDALIYAGINGAENKEGHVVPLLAALTDTVSRYYESIPLDISQPEVRLDLGELIFLSEIGDLFRSLMRTHYRSSRWVDKTPGVDMMMALPLAKQVWPNAKFVFMKRHGIENICSRMRKFPVQDFAAHCSDWATTMRLWLDIKDSLIGHCIEVDQSDMLDNPRSVAAQVAKFLDLTEKQEICIAGRLQLQDLEVTNRRNISVRDFVGANWSVEEITLFSETCGEMMRAYGYL